MIFTFGGGTGLTGGFLPGTVTFQNSSGSLLWAQVGPNRLPQTSEGLRKTLSVTVNTSVRNSKMTWVHTRSSSIFNTLQIFCATETTSSSILLATKAVWARRDNSLQTSQLSLDKAFVPISLSKRLSQAVKALVSCNGFVNELGENKSTTKHTNKDLEAMLSPMSGTKIRDDTTKLKLHPNYKCNCGPTVGVVEVCVIVRFSRD